MSERPDKTMEIAALILAALFIVGLLLGPIENPDPGEEVFSRQFLPLASLLLVAIAVRKLRSGPKSSRAFL